MTGPISPEEITEAKAKAIPEYVFEAVNTLLARKFTRGSCTIKQAEIMDAITSRTSLTRNEIFERIYLNFEEAYRNVGWSVVYDKPAYYEDYDVFFKFSSK